MGIISRLREMIFQAVQALFYATRLPQGFGSPEFHIGPTLRFGSLVKGVKKVFFTVPVFASKFLQKNFLSFNSSG